MNPNTALSASLIASLVLWFPSMQACLRGDLDLTPAAVRYLLALTISRLAMNVLARLLNAYRATQVTTQTPPHWPPDEGCWSTSQPVDGPVGGELD